MLISNEDVQELKNYTTEDVKDITKTVRSVNDLNMAIKDFEHSSFEISQENHSLKYQLVGDYYVPNIVAPKQEKVILNKYGRLRLKFLKEHKKANYTLMLIDGTLNAHLKEIQETAETRVNQLIDQLKEKSDLTEEMKNTDQLYWVGTMNAIKVQAEEIVYKQLIYV